MARSLEQISADLVKLETATSNLDEDIKTIYEDYFSVLGQAVKRQLILAAYHLCTQVYPEAFLALSVSSQEKMQSSIRKIATQGQTQIEQLGKVTDLSNLASRLEQAVQARYQRTQSPIAEHSLPEDEETDEVADVEETSVSPQDPLPDSSSAPKNEHNELAIKNELAITNASREATEMIDRLNTSLSLFSILNSEPLSPVSLAKRHVLLERHLRAILRTLSSLTNHLLKHANILPDLPEMVIATAAEADAGEGSSTPNVLSVLVEMGSSRSEEEEEEEEEADDEDEDLEESDILEEENDREMTHLVAINLRLADIEFADAHAALWRSRLQETLQKLKRLGSRYQKLQHEKARAEAEHAWRAVWFEE